MTTDIYTKYNIDISKLKRDYIKNPLEQKTKGFIRYMEKPYRDDFYYLYIDCNLSYDEMLEYFNCSQDTITRWARGFNIKKPKDLSIINQKQTNLEKFGCEYPFQNNGVKEKIKQTCLEKYGYETPLQNKEVKERMKQTNLEKYGCEYVAQNKEIREQQKRTCLEKYGYECSLQNKEVKEKRKQTFLEKYGCEYYTNRSKAKQTNLEKYGCEYASQNKEIQEKVYQTKKKNHSFNTSKPESKILILLKTKYPDSISQYKSKKYPFRCDYYIPSIDLYIEYQGHYSHGNEPYIGTNEQNEIIKLWESRYNDGHKSYKDAIEVWTKRDVLKRETAKKNNLNWVEFFNLDEFMDWFNQKK